MNTDTTKRYRLLKDLPYVKAFAIYERNEHGSYCCDSAEFLVDDIYHDTLANTVVENNPEWFEEVLPVSEPVKERKGMEHGLYLITWADEHGGGNSLASVGYTHDGSNWYSPCNWTSESNDSPMVASTDWRIVKSCSLIKSVKTLNNDTVVEDKNMSTVYFDKQVLNPHPTGTQAYTNWEQGFMEAANKYFKPYLSSLNSSQQSKQSTPVVKKGSWDFCHDCKTKGYCYLSGKCMRNAAEPLPTKQDKEWQVESVFIDGLTWALQDGKYINEFGGYYNISYEQLPQSNVIKSVRRISDNVVLTHNQDTPCGKIIKFEISDAAESGMWVVVDKYNDGREGRISICSSSFATPSKPIEEDKPIEYHAGDEVSFEIMLISFDRPKKITLNGKIKECLNFKKTATVQYLNPFTAEIELRDFEFHQLQSSIN